MPDYRNNNQRRTPPRGQAPVSRSPYGNRQYGAGRDRRPYGEDDYVGSRSRERDRRQGAYYDRDADPRARGDKPGEYLDDSSRDRYSAYPEEPAGRQPAYDRRSSGSYPTHRAADYDFDDFDQDDDWYYEDTSARRSAEKARPTAEEKNDDWLTDDFDDEPEGFEERTPYAAAPSRRGGRFEEDEALAVYRKGGVSADKNAGSAGSGFAQPGKRIAATVAICGTVLLIAVVAVAMIISSNRPKVMLPFETVLRNITLDQSRLMIDAYADEKLSSVVCNVKLDGNVSTLKLADCEMSFAGYDTERSTTYVTDTDDVTGEVIRTEYEVNGVFRYNKTALRAFLDSLTGESGVPVVDPYFEIDYEQGIMTVHSGSDGWGVDQDYFLSQLKSGLMAAAGDTVSLICSVGSVSAQPLSAADIYKQAVTGPVNAYTTTDSSGQTVYHSEINGVDFSQSELEQLLATGGTEWQMQVSVTFPETNLKDIRKYTFPDLLASYYTYYNANAVERTHNLSLAAEHINSIILEPGEQFSFNDTVGERTAANGFKKAGVYAGEGTSEDYGGGICQTSSTLYYTCILANLQIDERRNHMYTVGYMQTAKSRATVYGNDATVNWGYTDYKFTNNKEYPIRIDIWAENGIVTCEIRGTADGYTADLVYETVDTQAYKIKYLPASDSSDQSGQNGYTVNVYRKVYKDGVEISHQLESRNVYKPMNRIYYTNDLPAGYEYGVEYDQDYTPVLDSEETGTPGSETEE